MCDILIPALIIAGVALAAGTLGGNSCEPVCAPAACPPQMTYAASYSQPSPTAACAPQFTTGAYYDAKVVGFNQRGVPMVNADNRYGVAPATPHRY